MRILFVPYATALFWNGRYLWQRNLGGYLDGLSALFNEATVICHVVRHPDATYFPAGRPLYSYEMSSHNIRVVPFDYGSIQVAGRSLIDGIRAADFAYLFLPSHKGLLASLLCLLLRKPYALYMGAAWKDVWPYILPEHLFKPIRKPVARAIGLLEKAAVRGAQFTIAHGDAVVRQYGGEGRRVFSAVPVVNWAVRHSYERYDTCCGARIRVLYVGTLTPRKGIEFLIRGFGLAQRTIPSLQMVIVGAGEPAYQRRLCELTGQLGLQRLVQFVGYVADTEQLVALYRDADLFVLPTLGEGFPRVIYEAMSQGVPVITTDTGSLSTMLRHGETALLIQPRSAEAVANAIQELVGCRELRRTLIRHGYRFVRERVGDVTPVEQFGSLFSRFVAVSQRQNREGVVGRGDP